VTSNTSCARAGRCSGAVSGQSSVMPYSPLVQFCNLLCATFHARYKTCYLLSWHTCRIKNRYDISIFVIIIYETYLNCWL